MGDGLVRVEGGCGTHFYITHGGAAMPSHEVRFGFLQSSRVGSSASYDGVGCLTVSALVG
jgi:hypothetical protein